MSEINYRDVFLAHGPVEVSRFEEEKETPSEWQAMLETENTFASTHAYLSGLPSDFDKVDENFDSLLAANNVDDISEAQRIDLTTSRNSGEFDWKYENMMRERRNRQVLSEMSLTNSLSLGLAAAVTDPVSWAMAFAIPAVRGYTLGVRAVQGGLFGAADLTASEVILHQTQTERTLEESLANVGMGALFGGVLGSWVGKSSVQKSLMDMGDMEPDGAGTFYTATYRAPPPKGAEEIVGPVMPEPYNYSRPLDAGAAETRTYLRIVDREKQDELYDRLARNEITPEQMDIELNQLALEAYDPIAHPVISRIRRITPVLDMAMSMNWKMRQASEELLESDLLKKYHTQGKRAPHAIDTQIEVASAQRLMPIIQIMQKHYAEAVGTASSIKQIGKNMPWSKSIKLGEFSEGVFYAFMRNGEHPNPHIKAAAAEIRPLMKKFEQDLVDAGVLAPENFLQGKLLDEEIAELDEALFKVDAETSKALKEVELAHTRMNEARARVEGIESNFDKKKAEQFRKEKAEAERNLKAVSKRLEKARATESKRRMMKEKVKAMRNPYAAVEKAAKVSLKKVKNSKPVDVYARIEARKKETAKAAKRLAWIRNRLKDKTKRTTPEQMQAWRTERDKLIRIAKQKPLKADANIVAKYEAELKKAEDNVKANLETKGAHSKYRLEKERATQAYRKYPSQREVREMAQREKELKDIVSRETPEDVIRQDLYAKQLRTEKKRAANVNARAKKTLGRISKTIEKNKKTYEETTNAISAKAEERQKFKYSEYHGDPMGGGWYLPRIFKTHVVYENFDLFISRTTDDIIDQLREAADDAKLTPEERVKAVELYERAKGEGRRQIEKDMEHVFDKITSSETGLVSPTLSGANKFKAPRKLTVRTEALVGRNGDVSFIETDVIGLLKNHTRAMTPEMVLRQNDWNLAKKKIEINELRKDLVKRYPDKAKQINKHHKREIEKLEATHDIINNRYNRPRHPYSTLNSARDIMMNFNVIRALGSMPISAIPDLANIISRVGLSGLATQFTRIAMHPRKFNMGMNAVRKLNLVTERVMASRMAEVMMTGDMAPGMSTMARASHTASNHFVTATGMNHWNQTLKEFVLTAYSDEIFSTAKRIAKNGNNLSTYKRAQFAKSGIGDEEWAELARLHVKYGQREGGLEIPNIDNWGKRISEKEIDAYIGDSSSFINRDDIREMLTQRELNAKHNLLNLLKKEADTAIVTPGKGDLPLWMRSHMGGMIGQFKSFQFAAVNKIMVPGIQRMSMLDPNALAGLTSQLMLGAAVYGLKMQLQGKEASTDANVIIREAIDRSGYFGIFTDINAVIEKSTRGKLGIAGIYNAFGIEQPELSRYYTRPLLGDIIGPSGGTLEDLKRVVGSLASGEFTRGDISSWRRMIPYQNLWYLRSTLNGIQEYANERLID